MTADTRWQRPMIAGLGLDFPFTSAKLGTADPRVRAGIGPTVINMAAIKPNATKQAVKADIDAALKRRATRDSKSVQVSVEGGEVTLSGSVHSWTERELANDSAWGALGIRTVIDHMQSAINARLGDGSTTDESRYTTAT